MATDVKPATAASAAAVIESFAKNQKRREGNLDKIVFGTDKTLEGKKIVNANTQQPVSFQIILDAFTSLSGKTADVQHAIDAGALISPSLKSAHETLNTRIASVADNVQKAAVQTGIIEKQAEKPASRRPSVKAVVLGTVGVGAVGAAGTAGYVYRSEIAQAAADAWAKAPSRAEIVQFASDLYSKLQNQASYVGTPSIDAFTNASTPVKIAVGAGAAAVALGGIVYRKQIGNGVSAVARAVAYPFKACFNGLKNRFKSMRSEPVASPAALPAAPQAAVKTA